MEAKHVSLQRWIIVLLKLLYASREEIGRGGLTGDFLTSDTEEG